MRQLGFAACVLTGMGTLSVAAPAQQPNSAKALSDAAVDALKAKDNARARALSAQAVALQPDVNNLFVHSVACANLLDWGCAILDLEKAQHMARTGGADPATLNAIDGSLATAYLFGGHAQSGLDLAQELKRRDPGSAVRLDQAIATHFNGEGAAKIKAGDFDGAAAELEHAADLAPHSAPMLYTQAAKVLAEKPQPDWRRVEAEAEKAIAIEPGDGTANYMVGIAKANSGDKAGAIPYLKKAQANPGNDSNLAADTATALKKLGAE
jgi:Flp pilus assembly protein TadD